MNNNFIDNTGFPSQIQLPTISTVQDSVAQLAQHLYDLDITANMNTQQAAANTNTMVPRSAFIDPALALQFANYVRKPSPLTFETLKQMATRCKPVRMIIQTRKNQIANYSQPSIDRNEMGFKIALKDYRAKPTAQNRNEFDIATDFVLNTGFTKINAKGETRDNFDAFLRKTVEDRLVLDAIAIEKTRFPDGRLAEFYAIDAATIRPVKSKNYLPQVLNQELEQLGMLVPTPAVTKYIQEIRGQVTAEYDAKDLSYYIANPRTDVQALGYGFSELEMLIETITAHIFAEQYNRNYFSQGSIPPGVITLIGNYDQEMLEAFKRNWLMQVSGVMNAWRVPVVAMSEGTGFNYTPFHANSREMEYHLWITYLIAVTCAVYQIDPEEVGFQGYRPQAGGSLFQQTGQAKIEQSKDKGLKPLMTQIRMIMNDLIQEIWPHLCFKWTVFDEKSEAERLEVQTKELNMGKKTVNEIRAEDDLPEIKKNWANVPANSILYQAYVREEEMAAQQGQQEAEAEQGMAQAQTSQLMQEAEENAAAKQPVKKPSKKTAVKKSMTVDDTVVLELIV